MWESVPAGGDSNSKDEGDLLGQCQLKEKWNFDRMRRALMNRKNTRGTDGLYGARKRTHSSWKRSSKKVGKGSTYKHKK